MWVGPRVGPRWSQSPIWGLELSSNMTSTSEWQVVMKHLKMWPQTETCGECNLHTGFGRLSTKNNSFSYWLHIEMKAFWIYWLKYDIKTNFTYLFLFPNMVMRLLWITLLAHIIFLLESTILEAVADRWKGKQVLEFTGKSWGPGRVKPLAGKIN